MPKTLTPEYNQNLTDPFAGGAWLWLAEVVVPAQTTQRIACNTEDTVYGSDTFTKWAFDISDQVYSGDGSIPRVTLRIAQDSGRTFEQIVNDTLGCLDGTVKIIRANEKYLDTPVTALESLYDVLGAESDDEWVTLTLGIPNPLTADMPKRVYSASGCPFAVPALFKGPECGYAGADTTCTGTLEACHTKGNDARWGGDLGLDPNGITV